MLIETRLAFENDSTIELFAGAGAPIKLNVELRLYFYKMQALLVMLAFAFDIVLLVIVAIDHLLDWSLAVLYKLA